ncbi:MAG: hypothetical protein ACREQV_20450, partial [Candidatus Binatia bacterium]
LHARATIWRWRPAYQADFQARMDWCVKSFAEANHNPLAVINGSNSPEVLILTPDAGSELRLSAAGSSDPDGDALVYNWWVYSEAGSYPGEVEIKGRRDETPILKVPPDSAGSDLHVILEVIDIGAPALTSYRRVIVKVSAKR